MERYANTLARSLIQLGHPVVFHAHTVDEALAKSIGLGLEHLPIRSFPHKLQDFRFFREVDRWRKATDGVQLTLSRVRVRDFAVCGGTHRGYLARARKFAGVFDWFQVWMETEAYRCARVVVSHSDLCTRELIDLYRIPESKIVTLYPPVDERFAQACSPQQRIESRQKLGLPLDRAILFFPSGGASRKGLKPICQALDGLAEQFLLVVAGKPPTTEKWPFLRTLGYLDDMATAYRAADFTLIGSYYEPFGLVGPESVLCGTPLISEENVGCLPVIKPQFVYKFSVWDRASIRQAISMAIASARRGEHSLNQPLDALEYNPYPLEHAKAILRSANAPRRE